MNPTLNSIIDVLDKNVEVMNQATDWVNTLVINLLVLPWLKRYK